MSRQSWEYNGECWVHIGVGEVIVEGLSEWIRIRGGLKVNIQR